MKTAELTDEELDQILAAMDTATKAGGLQAAQVLLPLAAKLSQLRHGEQEEPTNGRLPQEVN